MLSHHKRYDTVVVTKDGLVSIDIRDLVIRLSQLTQDHYGYKVINMKNFSKNQLQNFMQQLYNTDEVGSDRKRIELDETTLTADSQDNFMILCILNFKNLGFYQDQETNAETEVETVPQLEAEPEAEIEATEEP